ncbi:MAG TPA: hypothetical protein VI365_26930 [Trebonia sp.]
MIIIIGLVILVAAAIVAVAGVLSNGGNGHALTHPFAVFGYHVTGSTGTLFLSGIVVGAVAMAGLSLLLAGARHTSRRGGEARRGLAQSRRETAVVTQDRDDLIAEREAARTYTASTLGNDPAEDNGHVSAGSDEQQGRWRLFGRRLGSPRTPGATPPAEADNGQPAVDVPAGDVPADASAAAE